jgi:pimeloyl-ACP methyl ester carboxylesterase
MSTDSPAVLLVHGAWHGAWAFDELLPHLAAAGLDASTVDLPSSGSPGPMSDDAALVRAALDKLGRPTIVVGHSYGGIVISEGAAAAPNAAGLVYLCAFMLDTGGSLLATIGGETPSWVAIDPEAGMSTITDPIPAFYGDVEPGLAQRSVERLGPQSMASFAEAQTQAAWQDTPSTYVICERDGAIPPELQAVMSANAGTVHRLDASHSPFLSRPAEVAAIVAAAAGGV